MSPGKLPKHHFSGDLTGGILPHLSQRVFFPLHQTLLAYSPRFHFTVPTVQSDLTTGLIRKNVPFLVHLGNHEHKPGVCLKVIWWPASWPLLLGNSKSCITATWWKPQLEWLSPSAMCNLPYRRRTQSLSAHTILTFLVFMSSYLQETPSCYNLSHPSLSCRTGLCSFSAVPGTCWVSPDAICPSINNASSRCKMHEFL